VLRNEDLIDLMVYLCLARVGGVPAMKVEDVYAQNRRL
jgi:hypothetical protein